MSISHREFFRLLPRAVGSNKFTVRGNSVEIRIGEGRLEIELSEESLRQIASLKLPETRLVFRFSAVTDEVKKEFLTQFDLAYQRGGG